MRLKHKFLTASAPEEIGGDGSRKFRGVASTTQLDRDKDRILAYDFAEFRKNPVLLLDHDPRKLIGKVVSVDFAGGEVPVEFELLPDGVVEHSDFAYAAIKHGALRGLSIGFIPGKRVRNEHGGYDYKSVTVIELSLTALQANPQALAARVGGKVKAKKSKSVSGAADVAALVDTLANFARDVVTKRGRVLSAQNEARLRAAKRAGDELAAVLAEVLALVDEPVITPEPAPLQAAYTEPETAPALPPKPKYLIRILPDPRESGRIPISPAEVKSITLAALETVVRQTIQRNTGRLD